MHQDVFMTGSKLVYRLIPSTADLSDSRASSYFSVALKNAATYGICTVTVYVCLWHEMCREGGSDSIR